MLLRRDMATTGILREFMSMRLKLDDLPIQKCKSEGVTSSCGGYPAQKPLKEGTY
jgi:hypothetical protein